MHLARAALICAALVLVGCAEQQTPQGEPSINATTDLKSSIAGKTLRCTADGTATPVTFADDGTISGQLLSTQATGNWFSRGAREVEIYVKTGSVAIRDVLKPSGSGWAGRNIRCS